MVNRQENIITQGLFSLFLLGAEVDYGGWEGQGEGDNMHPKSREDKDMMQQISGLRLYDTGVGAGKSTHSGGTGTQNTSYFGLHCE